MAATSGDVTFLADPSAGGRFLAKFSTANHENG
jgi:hypothetical protein